MRIPAPSKRFSKDPELSADEKRAILAAWASDMNALETSPMLRIIPGHTTPLRLSGLGRDDPSPHGTAKRMTAGNREADSHADVAPVTLRARRASIGTRLFKNS
jgi:hypothetical protein